ncbi:MAG: hypothetical protein ACRDEA_22630, partial [Microcystaceae cyanobacterium]
LYLCSEDGTRLKVKQAPREIDEALKISLEGADKRMKVGQMWKVKGKRQGNFLSVSEAELLESEVATDKTSKSFQIVEQIGKVGVESSQNQSPRSPIKPIRKNEQSQADKAKQTKPSRPILLSYLT